MRRTTGAAEGAEPTRPRVDRYGRLGRVLGWVKTRPRSFRTQIVASTMLLMAGLVVGAGLVLQWLLAASAERDVKTVLQDRSDAVISLVRKDSLDGAITVPQRLLDPGEQVYDGNGNVIAGTVEARVEGTAMDLGQSDTKRSVRRGDVRLYAVPFKTSGGLHGVVVVSQNSGPYERSETYALLAVLVLGVLVVATTGVISYRVTGQALHPVSVMAETAANWSETDLGRRFRLGGPTNEITRLGETLDHLLDRVARAIRSEQRLTSELAHELRTPLTAIQGSADLALMRGVEDPEAREDLVQIATSARGMAATIESLLELARDYATDWSLDTCLVTSVVDQVRPMVVAPLTLEDRTVGSVVRLAAPPALGTRALAPLVDNAAKFARTRVTIDVAETPGGVEIIVGDDGPGIDPATADAVFEPGRSASGGTGLGLGIARRVARSLGGDVLVGGGGAQGNVVLRLPRA